MISIEIDNEVFEKIKEISIPFVETTPNLVLRRVLGLPNDGIVKTNFTSKEAPKKTSNKDKKETRSAATRSNGVIDRKFPDQNDYSFIQKIENLRHASLNTHSAFLTFLMDKYLNTNGNYTTKQIYTFMEDVNLKLFNGGLRNPWMKNPYKNKTSCLRTIEHFRQTRKFGCWYGRNIKTNCDAANECPYHPDSNSQHKNKCDLRNGVIWKRNDPQSPFQYGSKYIHVVKEQLLNNSFMPLEPLLGVFYPQDEYTEEIIEKFRSDFYFSDEEMNIFFEV